MTTKATEKDIKINKGLKFKRFCIKFWNIVSFIVLACMVGGLLATVVVSSVRLITLMSSNTTRMTIETKSSPMTIIRIRIVPINYTDTEEDWLE